MRSSVSTALDSLRRPEYTGANRCVPCTALNAAIAVALTVALAVVFTTAVAFVAFVVFAATIYLRGYLVPKTPALTSRYLPDRIHRLFGNHATPAAGDYDDVESLLRSTDVVVDCPDEDDLCLEPAFREDWHDRMREIRANGTRLEVLADRLGLDPADLSLEVTASGFAANYGQNRIGIWPSEAAFLADLAAPPVLEAHSPLWRALEDDERGTVIAGLRVFLDQCPNCEGELEGAEETVESCCSSHTQASITCTECGSELLTAPSV